MALPNLSVPKYPNVPNLPGVPAVLRNPVPAVATLAAPLIGKALAYFADTWGVYDSTGKTAVITPDAFLGISYTNSRRIANYRMEAGSFASYNKVNDPFEGNVRMAVGGTKDDRKKFLDALQKLSDSLDLYCLVTPEATYKNVNLARFDYRREHHGGAGMIVANCHFVEIRQAETTTAGKPSTTAVKSPTAAGAVSAGQVTPKSPLDSIKSAISAIRAKL